MYIMQYIGYELLQINYKLSQMKTKTQPVASKDYLLHSLCYLLSHVSKYLDFFIFVLFCLGKKLCTLKYKNET